MNNWEILCKEYHEHAGEAVLYGLEVYRLVGLVEEPRDYYWVLVDFFGKKTFLTCVGSPAYLKGKIEDHEYRNLMLQFTVHEVDPEDPKLLDRSE